MVDYPSITFPVTLADSAIDVGIDRHAPRNDDETWVHGYYESENRKHAPVGLQLVGARMTDEKLVEVLSWIQAKAGLPFDDGSKA